MTSLTQEANDTVNLRSSLMGTLVGKIIAKAIRKKTGIDVDLYIERFDLVTKDQTNTISFRLHAVGTASKTDIMKLVE